MNVLMRIKQWFPRFENDKEANRRTVCGLFEKCRKRSSKITRELRPRFILVLYIFEQWNSLPEHFRISFNIWCYRTPWWSALSRWHFFQAEQIFKKSSSGSNLETFSASCSYRGVPEHSICCYPFKRRISGFQKTRHFILLRLLAYLRSSPLIILLHMENWLICFSGFH